MKYFSELMAVPQLQETHPGHDIFWIQNSLHLDWTSKDAEIWLLIQLLRLELRLETLYQSTYFLQCLACCAVICISMMRAQKAE